MNPRLDTAWCPGQAALGHLPGAWLFSPPAAFPQPFLIAADGPACLPSKHLSLLSQQRNENPEVTLEPLTSRLGLSVPIRITPDVCQLLLLSGLAMATAHPSGPLSCSRQPNERRSQDQVRTPWIKQASACMAPLSPSQQQRQTMRSSHSICAKQWEFKGSLLYKPNRKC